MDSLDALISRVCPFVAAGLVVGSIYWTAVTYGAVTVMQVRGHTPWSGRLSLIYTQITTNWNEFCIQVAGHKEGLTLMEQADPYVTLHLRQQLITDSNQFCND